MKNILKKYAFFIGIIIFLIILSKTNLGEIFKNIKNANPLFLYLSLILNFPMLLNKTWCWNYIKRQQGIKYKISDSFLMYCSGLYIGLLTPGRLGEISRAIYLYKDGHSMGKSLVSVFLDRISDFAFLFFFLLIGSLFFLTILQKELLILVFGIILSIIALLIAIKIGLVGRVIKKIFNKIIPIKYQKSWKINFQDFINDIKNLNFKNYLIIL